ncbi:hypothetical protein SBOR_7818 [Sclerotinia borealis F-4128]|uniref:Cytochrome p450 protein n=1 Tax=Sclerotinia borealis (strain F-4128) TaxID=1432307 RepID=W9C4Z4_SCLBF|nr:hypothetical protein SBOR_7818 [Sclerotinia borealis F-4128]
MKFISSLLFLFGGLTASAAVIEKRATSSFHLYAYGTGIGGLPIYYSDGNAFVGNKIPSGSTVNTNITFAPSSSSEWIITPTTANVTLTNSKSSALFINPSSKALTNVGFTASDSSTVATRGFLAFGNWAMWKSPDTSQISSSFYATPVSDGIWQLKWNADEMDDGSSVGVAIRKMAPSS